MKGTARWMSLIASTVIVCASCEITPCIPFGTLGQNGHLVFQVPNLALAVGATVEVDFQRTNRAPIDHVEIRSSNSSILEIVSDPTRMPVVVRGVSQGIAEIEVHGTLMQTLIDKTPLRVRQIKEISLKIWSATSRSDIDPAVLLVGHERSAWLRVLGDYEEALGGDLSFWASAAPEGAVGFAEAALLSVHEPSADYYGAREVRFTPLFPGLSVIEFRELETKLGAQVHFEAIEPERLGFEWWLEWDELDEPFDVWETYFFHHRLMLHYRLEDDLGREFYTYLRAGLNTVDNQFNIFECDEPGSRCWYWPEGLDTATLHFREEKTGTEVTQVVELPPSEDTEQTEPAGDP